MGVGTMVYLILEGIAAGVPFFCTVKSKETIEVVCLSAYLIQPF